MRAATPVLCLSFAWCLVAPPAAHALGFGRVATTTQLGQPLNFSAAVRVEADESLARECVFAEVTAGDVRVSPGLVRVALDGNAGDADRTVRVSTVTPIDEPVVAVSVTLGCTARVTRRFVAFIDPPGTNLAQGPSVEPAPMAVPRAASAPVDAATVTRAGAARLASAALASAPVRPAALPASEATAERRVAAPRRAATGPRLQLESPSLVLAAKAPAVTPAPAAAEPASVPARDVQQAETLALQQRRIASLEDEVRKLRDDVRAQQQALLAVRTATPVRRSERYATPLVVTLALLCLLATILGGGWLGRRSRDRQASRWAAGATGAAAPTPRAPSPDIAELAELVEASATAFPALPVDVDEPVEPEASTHRTMPVMVVRSPPPDAPHPVAPAVAPLRRPPPDVTLPVVTDEVALRADRSSSVEELIDLDQQVDFFVALGQDDAAIELLKQHAAGDGGTGPMPLLKLLEIHRRVGDRTAHDRVRARIDRGFNVHAPAWEADPGQGRSLDAYPETVARLQALWPTPAQAMALLDRAVFRRDAADPAFDLPAYRELLLLHSIARDHTEHETVGAGQGVDLLLPLDVDLDEAPISHLTASPADRPDFASSELLTAPLDLDVSFESTLPAAPHAGSPFDSAETVPAALRRPPDYANESAFVDFEIDLPGPRPPARRG